MFEIEKTFNAPEIPSYPSLGSPEKLLFFDIETTGLSPYNSALYLIGVCFQRNGVWNFRQWFSESLSDEIPVLTAFSSFLEEFETLVHYNGDTFDLPYLKALYEQYHLPSPFEGLKSIDLLKAARRIRPLLNPASLRQKDVEVALGIRREDRFSGAELIHVYREWQEKRNDVLLRDLLLHNEEDVKGMLPILSILSYDEVVSGNTSPERLKAENSDENEILLEAQYPFCFPFSRDLCAVPGLEASFSGNRIALRIPVIHTELKKFLPNPKAYYYLPKEDMIIPKELGSGVDPQNRVPARKDTCYVRCEDAFVPSLPGLSLDLFCQCLADKKSMVRLKDVCWEDYLKAFLTNVLTYRS